MKAARRCASCRKDVGEYARSVGLRRVCSVKCSEKLRKALSLVREWNRKIDGKPRKRLPTINRKRRAARFAKAYGSGGRHAAWVRAQGCVVPDCFGRPVEAAHTRSRGAGGTSRHLVGLCGFGSPENHHAEQHSIGVATFQGRRHVNLAAMAEKLWRESPYGERIQS